MDIKPTQTNVYVKVGDGRAVPLEGRVSLSGRDLTSGMYQLVSGIQIRYLHERECTEPVYRMVSVK